MELKDLQKMTVKKLKEEALKHSKIAGVHSMKKDELIVALKEALSIEESVDEAKSRIAETKIKLKSEIKKIKALRDTALESKDKIQLKKVRSQIKKLKRELRRTSV
jgi:prefoldin subunit 5